jgi:pimeloyl-ACP methyl ester carboxylesterase
MTRQSPLLRLHGVTSFADAWDDVKPVLAPHLDLIVPTAAGHRGGPVLDGQYTVSALVDDFERLLDRLGHQTVHTAGNSLGGWMAIALARRGRARSVCALSPAGFWDFATHSPAERARRISRMRDVGQRFRHVAYAGLHVGLVRRIALRDAAEHAERFTPKQAYDANLDTIECVAAPDLLDGMSEHAAPLDPLPCPITLAWSAKDRIFPPNVNGAIARQRIPQAHYLALPDVGHVPMIDDPELCARTILDTTRQVDQQN